MDPGPFQAVLAPDFPRRPPLGKSVNKVFGRFFGKFWEK
jgi:hypothetical protein